MKNLKEMCLVVATLAMTAGFSTSYAETTAGASEDFSTLKGVVGDNLTDAELASVEAKGIFPKGYCTWYVDQQVRSAWGVKNGTSWQGDAGDWYKNASKAAGVSVGKSAKANSIVVFNNGGFGHVAFVTATAKDGKSFSVNEMNYGKWVNPSAGITVNFNKVTSRTITSTDKSITGFIYKK